MTAQSIERPRKRKPKQLKPHKGSKAATILALTTTTDATPPEIAKAVKVTRQAVYDCLNRYGIQANDAESFKKHKAVVLNGMQQKIIAQLDDDRLKKASVNNLAYAFSQLHNAERLETGQTTGNIGVGVALTPALQESIDKIISRKSPVDNSKKEEALFPPLIESGT